MNKFHPLFSGIIVFMISLFITSCDGDSTTDPDPIAGKGISAPTWKVEGNTVSVLATKTTYNFVAVDEWSVKSSQSWCKLSSEGGNKGFSEISFTCEENTTGEARIVKIIIHVKDRSAFELEVRQRASDGNDADNRWLVNHMKETYLWNEPIDDLTLDYTLPYDEFWNSVLHGVAGKNNANRDDGVWERGSRISFYSTIKLASPTRASTKKPTISGLGIYNAMSGRLGTIADGKACFYIMGVHPGSPADVAGLKRGDCITKIDNKEIFAKEEFLRAAWKQLVYPEKSLSLTVEKLTVTDNGNNYKSIGEVDLNLDTFDQNPIWKSTVITEDTHKIGYIAYKNFLYEYDAELIEVFQELKDEKVTEIVLDLRYNPGGHVVSGVVMGTAIAGASKGGDVFTRLVYNENHKTTIHKIGVVGEGRDKYDLIATAFSSALENINTVYVIVTGSTASASELVINGLRGLGIKVRLIGQTTHGKNVGSAPHTTKPLDSGDSYDLNLISFYVENGEGYKDYPDGFKPDVEIAENKALPHDFGAKTELYLSIALKWIRTGIKPVVADTRTATTLKSHGTPEQGISGSIVLKEYPRQ